MIQVPRVLRPVRRAWASALAPVRDRIAVRQNLAELPKPVTFNEKVRYKMLADRRPLLTTFADKLAARAYVESKVGTSVLTDLYAATCAPETLEGQSFHVSLPSLMRVGARPAVGARHEVRDTATSLR